MLSEIMYFQSQRGSSFSVRLHLLFNVLYLMKTNFLVTCSLNITRLSDSWRNGYFKLLGVSVEEQMNGRTKHGTLMMKTLVRNGSFSFRDDEMVVNPQWIPPGGFIPHITEQLQHVAEAEVIIYRMEETGALIVFTREVSNLSVVYDMITYFWHMMTGMFDRVYNLFL